MAGYVIIDTGQRWKNSNEFNEQIGFNDAWMKYSSLHRM